MKDIQLSKKSKKRIDTVLIDIKKLHNLLNDFIISDQEDFDNIVELIEEYKDKKEVFEEEKKEFIGPTQQLVKKINSFFNPPIKGLEKCITTLREKIVEYESERSKKRIEEIRNKKKPIKKLTSNKVTYRTTWDYKIDNFDDIPRKYLTLDRSKVKIELREQQGNLEIPGIEIYTKKIPIIS